MVKKYKTERQHIFTYHKIKKHSTTDRKILYLQLWSNIKKHNNRPQKKTMRDCQLQKNCDKNKKKEKTEPVTKYCVQKI